MTGGMGMGSQCSPPLSSIKNRGWKDWVTKKTRLTKDRFQLWRQALVLKRKLSYGAEEGA